MPSIPYDPSDEFDLDDPGDSYTWEDAYAIAGALRRQHPELAPEEVSLQTVYAWTIALPNFADDPQIANTEILRAILREWYEESNPL
jgi:FeS assembly protein IscX